MANVAFSTTLSSLNAVPIIVERSLWWPGPTFATWHETHNSFGGAETGTLWVAAFGEVPQVLSSNMSGIANPTTEAATVRVTLLGDTGPGLTKTYTVAAKSRFNVDMAAKPWAGTAAGRLARWSRASVRRARESSSNAPRTRPSRGWSGVRGRGPC